MHISQRPLRIRDIFNNTADIFASAALCQAKCKIFDADHLVARYYPRKEYLELCRYKNDAGIIYNAEIQSIEIGKDRTLIFKVNA